MTDNGDHFEIIMKIILILFAVIAVYLIILRLIGNSSTFSEINFALASIIIISFITFSYRFGKFQGKVEEFINTSKNSFAKIKEDITNLRNKK